MWRNILAITGTLLALGILGGVVAYNARYWTRPEMTVAIEEVGTVDYPEGSANRSVLYNRYPDRKLRLKDEGNGIFTFIFESDNPDVATVTLRNLEVARWIPTAPKWTRDKGNLEKVTLIEREWNRQQVTFDNASSHLEISGGDGIEAAQIVSVGLARNCFNAGRWEIQLFTEEAGEKALYYHGWFTFPLGHYKRLFEKNNRVSYWRYWLWLEHWFDPEGTVFPLTKVRSVLSEQTVDIFYDKEKVPLVGKEPKRKLRTYDAKRIRYWGNFFKEGKALRFATFAPPGRYEANLLWRDEIDRLTDLKGATLRKVRSPAKKNVLEEIELTFENPKTGEINRFIVGGFDLKRLPRLDPKNYHDGYMMPMGVAASPVSQSYDELMKEAPYESGYFSVLLDEEGRWVNHHRAAIDSVILHRDIHNERLLHLYLLSYKRHILIGHYILGVKS